jgi:hypothetical protein
MKLIVRQRNYGFASATSGSVLGWSVGGIVRERLISKAPARASERYHCNQQSKLGRVRVERFRTSFFIYEFNCDAIYEFICDAGDLKLTRGIIVIVGEKGKCHQALSNKNAGMYSGLSSLLKSLSIGILRRLQQTPTVRCTSLAVDLSQ